MQFNVFSKNKRKSLTDRINDIPTIVVGDTSGSTNSSYNRLKDNIIYYIDEGKRKVFQIESSIAGEGKSTIVANLAVALAKNDKKVVVVDLDFRSPKMHKCFRVLNTNGIAEFMLGECDTDKLIKKSVFDVDVVNRGKSAHNASIIFTSEKFKNLILKLREEYDVVLFDCPPILQVSEYMHIAKHSDAVIMVVSAGIVRKSQLTEAVKMLKLNDIEIFGTVMTYENEKQSPAYNEYAYYGKNYGNYGQEK